MLINRYVESAGEIAIDSSDTEAGHPLQAAALPESIPYQPSDAAAPQVQDGALVHAATRFSDGICIAALPPVGAFEDSSLIQAPLEHASADEEWLLLIARHDLHRAVRALGLEIQVLAINPADQLAQGRPAEPYGRAAVSGVAAPTVPAPPEGFRTATRFMAADLRDVGFPGGQCPAQEGEKAVRRLVLLLVASLRVRDVLQDHARQIAVVLALRRR
jgi:hypothetical protein